MTTKEVFQLTGLCLLVAFGVPLLGKGLYVYMAWVFSL